MSNVFCFRACLRLPRTSVPASVPVALLVAFVTFSFFAWPAQLFLGSMPESLPDNAVRPAVKQLAERIFTLTAGKAGVMAIHLLFGLHAGHANLFGLESHHMIATSIKGA